jgi:hypothetical protein
MAPNQPTRQGAERSAIWLIGQVLQRRRWADLAHHRARGASFRRDRLVFRARRTALGSAYGQSGQSAKPALPAGAKNQSNDPVWSKFALGIFEGEWRETVPISLNPEGTWRLSPLDVALRGLKGAALLRRSKLVSSEMRHASTTTYFVSRS